MHALAKRRARGILGNFDWAAETTSYSALTIVDASVSDLTVAYEESLCDCQRQTSLILLGLSRMTFCPVLIPRPFLTVELSRFYYRIAIGMNARD